MEPALDRLSLEEREGTLEERVTVELGGGDGGDGILRSRRSSCVDAAAPIENEVHLRGDSAP